MTDPNSERLGKPVRRHVRIEVHLGVRFMIEGDANHTVYQAVTKNVSRGGLCLMTHAGKDRLIAASQKHLPRLKVSLFVGEGESPIELDAKTSWISSKIGWFMTPSQEDMPLLVGMEFEELTTEDTLRIDSLIESCLFRDREPELVLEEKILARLHR